ncbi:MAG TPA: hypothetical protein VGK24_11355 [Candidatus Angelobacter sp.]
MKLLKILWPLVLITSLGVAQSSNDGGTAGSANLTDEVKQLREAVAEQKQAMADQQKQVSEQRQEIERLKQQLNSQATAVAPAASDVQAGHVVNASVTAPSVNPAVRTVSDIAQEQERPVESPLSFKIGNATFTPGGFLDFTAFFRTTNVGSLGTNFFAIPFSNTPAGQLTETRFTAQNSRVNMKVGDKFGRNDVTGFFEMDFLGNDAANVFVTSNSHTMRLRHYFVDYKRDKWEILGGQTWSWMTPNRVGLSPYSQDVFYSQDMDFNYQAGLTWARSPQFRVAYHANDHFVLGVALENPEQFAGQGEVLFPAGLAQVAAEFDAANSSTVPNLHPDIVPKIAYDTDLAGKHFHVEAVGLVTSVKDAFQTTTGGPFTKNMKTGYGGEFNLNLEIIKNFRLIANSFYSDGGGRYIFGMGPQAVVLPNGEISLVHSASTTDGFEYQMTKKSMLYGYYGGAYFQRNFALDTSTGAKPNTFIGFGGPNSSTNNNRAIQEGTLGWVQTFWKNPQYGAFQLITQYSYLTRAPWFLPVNNPKNAHLGMAWADLRFTLP